MNDGKEEEEKKEKSSDPSPSPHTLQDYLGLGLTILLVILIGLLTINQSLEWFYKVEFMRTPCQLCEDLNPQLQECFEDPPLYIIEENISNQNLIIPAPIS